MIRQLIPALAEMKKKEIIHRDIKAGNVLIFSSELQKQHPNLLKDIVLGNEEEVKRATEDVDKYMQTVNLEG